MIFDHLNRRFPQVVIQSYNASLFDMDSHGEWVVSQDHDHSILSGWKAFILPDILWNKVNSVQTLYMKRERLIDRFALGVVAF
jgi:hypothetical protein